MTSADTEAVAPAPPPLNVSLRGAVPAAHDGSTEFTFEIEFSEEFPLSYKKLKLHAFDLTDGEVLKAQRVDRSSNISWRITVRPGSNADVTVVLPVITRCGAQGPSAPGTAGNCPTPWNSPSQARSYKGPNMWTRRGSFRRSESTRVSRFALRPEALLVGNPHVRRPSPGEEAGGVRRKSPAPPRGEAEPGHSVGTALRSGHVEERADAPVRAFAGLPVPAADGRQAQSIAAYPAAVSAGAWGKRLRLPVHPGNRRISALADRHEGEAGKAKRTPYFQEAGKAAATSGAFSEPGD